MTIHIEDLKFQAILGILDFERVKVQDVIVNVKITYDYAGEFINYAYVATLIKENMQESKFLLIEDALENISISLKDNFPHINELLLKITKPSILPDCSVSVSNHYNFNS